MLSWYPDTIYPVTKQLIDSYGWVMKLLSTYMNLLHYLSSLMNIALIKVVRRYRLQC